MAEPIKIHPFDVFRLLQKYPIVDIFKHADGCNQLQQNQLIIDGQLYEQTTDVPASAEALQMIR